jgi:hypothetical protein
MRLRRIVAFPTWSLRNSDVSLSALLVLQAALTFVAIPLVGAHAAGPWLVDGALLIFAVLCAIIYAHRVGVLLILLSSMLAILLGPTIWNHFMVRSAASAVTMHESILFAAFCFNALITGLVTRQTFGAGPVTRHRILGAVLVYLNVAVLFSIVYDLLDILIVGAIQPVTGGLLTSGPGARRAEMVYFSLSTITSCGFGDLVPVHPFVRSLANLEAVIGQLFPATFVARLVAQHVTLGGNDKGDGPGTVASPLE